MTDRHTLEADLLRYQDSGDFAAQAETLMALAQIASNEWEQNILVGLYGQAWTAYERAGNKPGMIRVVLLLSKTPFNLTRGVAFALVAFRLCEDEPDLKERAILYLALQKISESIGFAFYARRAYQLAFDCYETLGDMPEQIKMISRLPSFSTNARETLQLVAYYARNDYVFFERAISAYQEIGDEHGERLARYELGAKALLLGDYGRAHVWLEDQQTLFLSANDGLGFIKTALLLLHLTFREHGYSAAYINQYLNTLSLLRTYPTLQASLNRWSKITLLNLYDECARIASEHQDFATARSLYQQALSFSVALDHSDRQILFYAKWGLMEYGGAQRREMGLCLYQRAVTLFEHRFPSWDNPYAQRLAEMQSGSPSNSTSTALQI